MMTLIFNNDVEHPINADHISYNVMYQTQNQNRSESLSGSLSANGTMTNLNHFENEEINQVIIRSDVDGIADKELNFLNPLTLTSMNIYQDANSAGGASFNMAYYAS